MRKLHPQQEIVGLSGLTIEDFWIWAYSDLLTNVTRNAFAEFMVGFVLARLHAPKTGQENVGFDYRDRRVIVKAASYIQSELQKKKSKINFDIGVRQNLSKEGGLRDSDCYVFCLFDYDNFDDKDAARNALLDTDNWQFYVVSTDLINKSLSAKKTTGVRWMEENCPGGAVRFSGLKRRIDDVLGFHS